MGEIIKVNSLPSFWWQSIKRSWSKTGAFIAFVSTGLPSAVLLVVCDLFPNLGTTPVLNWANQGVHWAYIYIFSVLVVVVCYLAWSPYRLYRDLEKEAADDGLAHRKETQQLRQQLFEEQSKRDAEDQAKIIAVAAAYAEKSRQNGGSNSEGGKLKLLIQSGLLELETIPNAIDRLTEALRLRGVANAIAAWNKPTILPDAAWMVRNDIDPTDQLSLWDAAFEAATKEGYALGFWETEVETSEEIEEIDQNFPDDREP